ncbi:MAG TPA: formylmethanofuran dehydrogenase subunit C, partial [Planctomycetaceae bacterium]|nr:formylmethanofuran dehydrogenase subunit C [Planctomycetaceae bacterium]
QLETVRGQSADEVRHTAIQYGNTQVPLGDFFDVAGSAADNALVWEGDCSKVKLIGAQLTEGTIRVEGNAGMHLGAGMRGGAILVSGNADDWVGAEMHAGRIHIRGNAGDLVGAVYRGGRRGMTGGEILVDGNAGSEIGHTMRRGLIAIGGRTGDAVGFSLIAGSILLFGEVGVRPGAGMKRGTIGLLGTQTPPKLLPTFKFAGISRPVFLQFYLRRLREMGFFVPDECFHCEIRRYCGDFLELGKGEILLRASV